MRRTWMLVVGIVLVVVGLAGAAAVLAAGTAAQVATSVTVPSTRQTTPAPFQTPSAVTLGEQIYVTGATPNGALLASGGPIWFRQMGGGCALCHGVDGKGRSITMMGSTTAAPDIRYTTLTQAGSTEPSASVGPWSDADIVSAIRDGLEPGGAHLDPGMPLWSLSDAQAQALLAYLKELK